MFNILMEFGSKNLIILLVLLVLVVIATIIVFVVDKNKDKREIKEAIREIDNKVNVDVQEKVASTPIVEEKVAQTEQLVEDNPLVEPVIETKEEVIEDDIPVSQETIYEEEKQEEEKKEEAKQELERLEKTLQEEKEERVGPTDFEIEQERTAIINYEELKKAAGTIESRDEKLLQDEGNEPISIDDLYRRENTKREEIKEETKQEEVRVEIEKQEEEKKFKNSEVLSPVFGVTKEHKDLIKDVRNKEVMEAVDLEIAKTEKFLKELKELREKLY